MARHPRGIKNDLYLFRSKLVTYVHLEVDCTYSAEPGEFVDGLVKNFQSFNNNLWPLFFLPFSVP